MYKNYKSYIFVILYLVLLRIILNITIGLSVFNFGIFFDIVLMMFWVGIVAFFFKKAIYQKVYYIIVMLISTVFVIGDSVYYGYFSIITSKTSLGGLKFLQQGQTLEYDIQIPLVAYLVTPVFFLIIYLIISNKDRDVFRMKDFKYLSVVFVIQVALFLFWGSYEFDNQMDYYRSDAYLFDTMHDRTLFSERYGYYNYHLLDLVRFRVKNDETELVEDVTNYFEELELHTTNDMSDVYDGYNVITITAESLDVRFIDETLTPNLYMMMENGYTFENYFTPVFQQGATCNSEYMGLSGLNAITSNDWSNNICDSYSENSFPFSMPAQLSNAGYDTYYFHSGFEWFYNRENMVPQYGFDTVKFQEDMYESGKYIKTEEERTNQDQIIFEEKFDSDMIHFLDEYVDYTNPFHINLLTYSMHGAYNQAELYPHEAQVEAAYPNNEFDEEIISYMEKLVEFDNMIGELLDTLEGEGVLDNTLIAIYPDHHVYMMNYKTYTEHLGLDLEEHSYELHRQNLILYATDMEGTVYEVPGSTIDITPTLLNMLDSSSDFSYFMGTDLFGTDENYVIFGDLTITDGHSFLTIREKEYGDPINRSNFENALLKEIEALDIQKMVLNSDYFKQLDEE